MMNCMAIQLSNNICILHLYIRGRVTDVELVIQLKPVTNEQVFYNKFLCDNCFIYWCERVNKFTLTIY
jgi:hypothetical protein